MRLQCVAEFGRIGSRRRRERRRARCRSRRALALGGPPVAAARAG